MAYTTRSNIPIFFANVDFYIVSSSSLFLFKNISTTTQNTPQTHHGTNITKRECNGSQVQEACRYRNCKLDLSPASASRHTNITSRNGLIFIPRPFTPPLYKARLVFKSQPSLTIHISQWNEHVLCQVHARLRNHAGIREPSNLK